MATLQIKDFERIRTRWNQYWNKELSGPPMIIASHFDSSKIVGKEISYWNHAYQYAHTRQFDKILDEIELILQGMEYFCDTVPYFSPDNGPDQFAACCGTKLEFAADSGGTNWASPVVEDWKTFLPVTLHEDSATWHNLIDLSTAFAAKSNGKFAVGMADLHSNIDTLAALRGPAQLCMDFYEQPDLVMKAIQQVMAIYPQVYNRLFEAGSMAQTGSIGWIPFWCDGRFASMQADFICMTSPEISRQFIIPALESEAEFLDHSVYHLDGPGALIHLDDILAIKKIDAIQWVPGAGQPPQYEWMEVLTKCQKAGKGLQLFDCQSLDIIKKYHHELNPQGLVYCLNPESRDKKLEMIEWLTEHSHQ